MIVDERLVTYINSLDRGNTPVLDEIEKEALRDFVPIIRKEMQSFLKLLLAMQKPMRILEVGTAVGFSAVLMAEYAPKDCQIVTIENYEKRIPIAKANFERAGKQEQITLLEGDATEMLPQLEGQFDMIFMDAAKGQYINFMPQVLRLLKTGGVLVSDNVLQDEKIWRDFLGKTIIPESNSCELYFEEQDIERFVEKLERLYPNIQYVNRLMTHSWGQKVVRFYDLDGNLIEVGTPM